MSNPRTKNVLIRTPEGVEFSLVVAGPVARLLALMVDAACITALTGVVAAILSTISVINKDLGMAVVIVANFVISVGYAILLEWFLRGQTLGKRLLRLRVMDSQGLQLQVGQVVTRNLLRVVDSMPFFYLVGGISSFVNPNGQRLGDLAAGTIVIRLPELSAPSIDRLPEEKYNSLAPYPHLLARLRRKITSEEASIALRALLRRDELDPSARAVLFRELADNFKELVTFPPEATEGLTDERYVRNVVEIIYGSRKNQK